MVKKELPINYEALKYLKSLLDPVVKIMDVYVRNHWLCAELSSNVRFMVRNNDRD